MKIKLGQRKDKRERKAKAKPFALRTINGKLKKFATQNERHNYQNFLSVGLKVPRGFALE